MPRHIFRMKEQGSDQNHHTIKLGISSALGNLVHFRNHSVPTNCWSRRKPNWDHRLVWLCYLIFSQCFLQISTIFRHGQLIFQLCLDNGEYCHWQCKMSRWILDCLLSYYYFLSCGFGVQNVPVDQLPRSECASHWLMFLGWSWWDNFKTDVYNGLAKIHKT